MRSMAKQALVVWTFSALFLGSVPFAEAADPLRVLFLGDQGHHRPADRFRQIDPVLRSRGIELTYSEDVNDLNPKTLAGYKAVLLYANIDKIGDDQEQALLDYVNGGGGFVPVHCASYCFRNSAKVVALMGAQFLRHGTGVMRDTIAEPDHPLMKGYRGFESWDETYVHHQHNTEGRTVLAYRVDNQGREPWTWVRTQGKGRVFYTAWGHDERTWGHPGFENLLERGIRWASATDPAVAGAFADRSAPPLPTMTPKNPNVKPFEYDEAKIAFYPPDGNPKGDGQWNKMQRPVDPAESQKHIIVPEGFTAELFASEPQIDKPLCMNWDERGRLWIAESVDYPNELKSEGLGRDRIKICEDTDGDGRADKFTIFADKLSIPTSLTFSQGGLIVHQAPQTLFLKDNDGDDKADERRVLFGGWRTHDTHAGPSNLRYGLDNWIWGMVGYSGFSGQVGGEALKFSQGFYRFKSDGSALEFLRSTSNNSWGVGISEEGLVFGSTANRNPSMYLAIPNRYYEAVRGWSSSVLGMIADTHMFKAVTDRVRQVDHHGGYTAGAGHALYTARAYPEFYWNRTAFVAEPTGHLVGTFVLTREGSDFHSTNPVNLFASDDEWTAPTMAEVGPDGQVWVIDWYNYIVQHNPTPAGFATGRGGAYETDLRDKTHGRIYRIVNRASKLAPPLSLAKATPGQLVDTLKNSNMFWRIHAQRLLVERGDRDVLPALFALTRDPGVDAIGLNPAAIHALWTIHGLGALDGTHPEAAGVAIEALGHKSAGVRMNALKVLPRNPQSLEAILTKGLIDDPDALVRLNALLALSEMPESTGVGKAVAALLMKPENAGDRWIPDAATAVAARNALGFLQAVATTKPVSPRLLAVTNIVAEHYARGGPIASVNTLIASLGDADPSVVEAVVAGLVKGWPKDRPATLDEKAEKTLAGVLTRISPGAKGQLLRLATAWGSRHFETYAVEVGKSLLADVQDEKQTENQRIATAKQLIGFRPDDSGVVDSLLEIITPRTSPTLAKGIIEALSESRAESVGPALVKLIGRLTPTAKSTAIGVLLRRPVATTALLNAIENQEVSLGDLTLDQTQSLAAHPEAKIRQRARALLARGGSLPNADRQKVIEELSPLVLRKGDAALGKVVFQQQCLKCHTHGAEGGKVGPDLTGMAVHPKEELLVHILDPSRSVEGNYRQYNVATTDGQVFVGVLTSETKTAIELGDAEGKPHVILRADVEELQASPKSIMPEGFEKQVNPEGIANLLEFLTQRGKFLPLDLAKSATIVSTTGMFYSKDAGAERLIFGDWSPKTFEGVPFRLVDPRGERVPNVIMLFGPAGTFPPTMPKSVSLACNVPAKTIHLLSGVSGWGYPGGAEGSVSMIVRLHYAGGATEDHPLKNGIHFADYIRRVDVPESKYAFPLRGQQIRYLAITPKRNDVITQIEFVKGPDGTAPVVMAVTVEDAE
ncbi:PVC-type heme-binding CxxCH protein [Singulisphaera acidiphila]|uniref:Putative membrane-bound dehydrogenase n=1 Tax=Singulisphaera acidiphila (strain ATCC BAA-1392 / DSM 18658 / VKM B-2454 / MOB10) TaxID=886293 RepID=L0DCJ8_SINAD|nr:PVC-type heme-binding CxxCH protein [Singulisphaera acidiphila]AGA27104.1 putative membrane-bound dehydrogenase [Singulisphaera acidiphila DSM 18658]